MPNGGTDNCGMCMFNEIHKNLDIDNLEHHNFDLDKSMCRRWAISEELKESYSMSARHPYWTYCSGYSQAEFASIIKDNEDVFLIPPHHLLKGDEPNHYQRVLALEVRPSEFLSSRYLSLLDKIACAPDEISDFIWTELGSLREEFFPPRHEILNKLIEVLLKYISIDFKNPKIMHWQYGVLKGQFEDKPNLDGFEITENMQHVLLKDNKYNLKGQVLEFLLKITQSTYLDKISPLLEISGLDEKYLIYTATVRYHLVRGLRYCNCMESVRLLEQAQNDPNRIVREFATDILERSGKRIMLSTEEAENYSSEDLEKYNPTIFSNGRVLLRIGAGPFKSVENPYDMIYAYRITDEEIEEPLDPPKPTFPIELDDE